MQIVESQLWRHRSSSKEMGESREEGAMDKSVCAGEIRFQSRGRLGKQKENEIVIIKVIALGIKCNLIGPRFLFLMCPGEGGPHSARASVCQSVLFPVYRSRMCRGSECPRWARHCVCTKESAVPLCSVLSATGGEDRCQ